MAKINATPNVIAETLRTSETTVAVALTIALNNPKNFQGKKPIEREAAVYVHPSPRIKGEVTSRLVDRVLLDDESEAFQCRTCGSATWKTARSAVAHASSHSRTTVPATGAPAEMSDKESPVVKSTHTSQDKVSAPATSASPIIIADMVELTHTERKPIPATVPATVHPDVRELIRNLRAVTQQLRQLDDAMVAIATEVVMRGEKMYAKPEVDPAELAKLREDSQQLAQLRAVLGNITG